MLQSVRHGCCNIRNGLPALADDENIEPCPLPVLDIYRGHADYTHWTVFTLSGGPKLPTIIGSLGLLAGAALFCVMIWQARATG